MLIGQRVELGEFVQISSIAMLAESGLATCPESRKSNSLAVGGDSLDAIDVR
jgi:hypothetical protein